VNRSTQPMPPSLHCDTPLCSNKLMSFVRLGSENYPHSIKPSAQRQMQLQGFQLGFIDSSTRAAACCPAAMALCTYLRGGKTRQTTRTHARQLTHPFSGHASASPDKNTAPACGCSSARACASEKPGSAFEYVPRNRGSASQRLQVADVGGTAESP